MKTLLGDTVFNDLASCAWIYNADSAQQSVIADVEFEVTDLSATTKKRTGGRVTREREANETDLEYVVDRETVLLKVLDWIVFTPGVKGLLVELLKIDETKLGADKEYGDHFDLDDPNTDYLIAVLISSIFEDQEPLERLLIDLLSWYQLNYAPQLVVPDEPEGYYDDPSSDKYLGEPTPIDYEAAEVNKENLEKLPAEIDKLVAAIIPAVTGFLPEGLLGDLTIQGETTAEIVENLVVGLFKDSDSKDGLATTLMATDKATILRELRATLKIDEDYLANAKSEKVRHEKSAAKCKELITQLDTEFAERQAMESRLSNVEGMLQQILSKLNDK